MLDSQHGTAAAPSEGAEAPEAVPAPASAVPAGRSTRRRNAVKTAAPSVAANSPPNSAGAAVAEQDVAEPMQVTNDASVACL